MAQTVPVKTTSGDGGRVVGGTDPFTALRRQVDHLFDDFTSGLWGLPFGRGMLDLSRGMLAGSAVTPQIDVKETPDSFQVTAELPGLAEKDVTLTIADNVLTLKGEKKAEREEKNENYYLSERSFGSFTRSVQLPATVDQDKVTAKFDKGILTIALPKVEEAKTREKKIEIKSA
jgi:HSP20 family protein